MDVTQSICQLTWISDIGQNDILHESCHVEVDVAVLDLTFDDLLNGAECQHRGFVMLPPSGNIIYVLNFIKIRFLSLKFKDLNRD